MSVFDWCIHGQHGKCPGAVVRFHMEPKTNEPVVTGTTVCDCKECEHKA